MHRDTDIAGKYRYRTAMVRDLEDGDLFSLDEGQTWHIAWGALFGTVSVWANHTGTPLVRIPADEDQEVVILDAFRRDEPDEEDQPAGSAPAAEAAARVFPFVVPTRVEVAGPDQECPTWQWEAPRGRHAMLIGDPDDGGVAYCGTLPELEAFLARAQAALYEAQLRQQAGPAATRIPPPQPDAVVTSRVVTIFDLTSRQRAELADELGVDRSVRRLPRGRDASGALTGVKLDSQYGYDLDAAVAYARRAGLRYIEVRETTFQSW